MPQSPVDPPVIPSGQEIYDSLMQGIEPELVSTNLPLLSETYKDETSEEVAARAERYDRAFAEYDRQLEAYFQHATEEVRIHYRTAKSSLERGDREQEAAELSQIEDIFTHAA